jgi:branched-chain amino acid transport system substrate-binding protein
MNRLAALCLATLALAATPPHALAATQGVTKDEVVIGTIQDLSGPIAAYGKAIRNGLLMWAEETNEQGGIHGRRVRVVVDDSSYDLKKAVLAAQKQVEKDRVFVSVANLGTAVSLAVMPVFLERNLAHLFPLSSARQMYEPLHPLKFSFAATYYDQMRSLVRHLAGQRADRRWCLFYQDDEFGIEVLRGVEAGLQENGGRALVEKTSFKRGALEFTSQVQKMKAAGCDTVVVGAVARDTASLMSESRKLGLDARFAGSSATYTHLLPLLAGPVADGLVVTHTVAHPYLDDASERLRFWANKYRTRFNEAPDVFAVYGYLAGDMTGAALAKAGPNLTTATLVRALESLTYVDALFGADKGWFAPDRHLSSNTSRIAEIRGGRWVTVSGYVAP